MASMPDASAPLITACFAPPQDCCWRWDEHGRTLIWEDGTTIAFRDEIVELLTETAPQGWPSFGAVALLLAACRPSWPAQISCLDALKRLAVSAAGREAVVAQWLQQAMAGLEAVQRLPSERRSGLAAKATLLRRIVTASLPRWSAENCAALAAGLAKGVEPQILRRRPAPWWPELRQELAALAFGLQGLDAPTLELQQQTGLSALPETPAEWFDATEVRRFLLALGGDPVVGALVQRASLLLGVLRYPQRLEPEVAANGAAAGITNRGTPDRLLLSELAHEDSVLMARLALGEALYSLREPPQRSAPRTRRILLDRGIRLWGQPRPLAAIAVMGWAGAATHGMRITVHAARGAEIVRLDPISRAGLIALLDTLETTAHPGLALAAWCEQSEADDERILITHPRTVDDPAFRAAWQRSGSPALLVTTVDGDGHLDMLDWQRDQPHRIASAQIEPVRSMPRDVPAVRKVPSPSTACPAEQVRPFPLRVPHGVEHGMCWPDGAKAWFTAAPHRRLTWWPDDNRGPLELADHLPQGRLAAVRRDQNDIIALNIGADPRLIRIHPDGRRDSVPLISGNVAITAWFIFDHAVVVHADGCTAYALDGRMICEDRSLAALTWVRDVFFRDQNSLIAVIWDGTRFNRTVAVGRQNTVPIEELIPFYRRHKEGIWWLANQSFLSTRESPLPIRLHPAWGDPLRIESPSQRKQRGWRIDGISSDGERVAVTWPRIGHSTILDLSGESATVTQQTLEPVQGRAATLEKGILRKVRAVGSEDGHLLIAMRRGSAYRIYLHGQDLRTVQTTTSVRWYPLDPIGTRSEPRWLMRHNDIEAVVDDRGVLHLTDRQSTLPGLALLLRQGSGALWSARHGGFGLAHFLAEAPRADPADIAALLLGYARRLA